MTALLASCVRPTQTADKRPAQAARCQGLGLVVAAGGLLSSVMRQASGTDSNQTTTDGYRLDGGWVQISTYAHPRTGDLTEFRTYYNELGLVIALEDTVDGLRLFSYDEAHQLIGVRSEAGVHSLTYSPEGFLTGEVLADGTERSYSYDLAGQLVRLEDSGAGVFEFVYDALGRRVRVSGSDGGVREFVFGPGGGVPGLVVEHNNAGEPGAGESSEPGAGVAGGSCAVWVDVLGQVAGVCAGGCCTPVVPGPGSAPVPGSASPATSPATPVTGSAPGSCASASFLSWDLTAPAPRLLGAGGVPVSLGAAVCSEVTGVRGVDPFGFSPVVAGFGAGADGAGLSALTGLSAPAGSSASGLPGSSALPASSALPGSLLGLTAAGSLALGGLEVLGARVYDAGVRGFLSVDPVAAPVGAGWASNGYGFVGFSPVGLVDPWGLSPMSAADFYAYRQNRSSAQGSHVLSALGQALQGFGSFAAGNSGGGLGWFGSGGLFGPGAGLDLGALARAGAGVVGSALEWGRGFVDGAQRWWGDAQRWLGDAWSNVQGFASKAWEWTKDNWQYLLAGAVTVAALISLATPAAPLGTAVLLNMGAGALASTGLQAANNGWDLSQVNYKQVALDSAISGISAPIGAGAGAFAASRGLGLVGRTAVTEMASGGAQGALTYALDPSIGSKSLSGFAGYTASGVVSGGVQGGAASKTNLFLNRHLGGYVAPGQVAWHLQATAAVSGAAGGGLGGGLNYVGQEVSKGKSLDSITMEDIQKEAIKGGLQSGISSFDVKNLQPVGEVPVMNGVNLGSHMPGSVVAPSSYNTHLVVNGDSYVSPATGQTVYSMPGSLNGVSGEFRVVVEQVDGGEAVRRQFFVPQG